ncbi:MAG: carboxypeptidase-like regulatory domain-containing protein [bacterium]
MKRLPENARKRRKTQKSVGFYIFLLFFVSSCWQEQHHEVIPPPLPNYPVKGKVFDSADGTPVRGAIVFLDTEADTTDSTGSFYLEHIQGGKSYSLSVMKDHYEPFLGSVLVAYDTVEVDDIILGKIYYHLNMFNPGGWRSFTPQGLVWGGANLWSADSMAGVIFAHNYDSYMSVAQKYALPHYPMPKGEFYIAPLGLEWHRNYVVTYDDHTKRLYELILTAGDTALIQTSYRLPDEIGDIWDFTWDGHQLWSCSPGSYKRFHALAANPEDDVIYRHNGDLSVVASFPATEIDDGILNPAGIAWDGEKFWLNSRASHRLYMLDENLQVLGYYVFEESIWPWTPYQLCWGNGYLWGCFRDTESALHSVGGPTQYLYKFGKLYP